MPAMLPPRSAFRAPPVAPVQGIAARGPAAAASATGGVPVITTDQGVKVPAPPRPAGLESLVTNMQQEVRDLKGPEDLPKLNYKMAKTGEDLGRRFRGEIPGGEDVLSGGEGDEVLVGGEDELSQIDSFVDQLNDDASRYSEGTSYFADGPIIYRRVGNSPPVRYARMDSKGRLVGVAPDSVPSVVQRRGDGDAPVVASKPPTPSEKIDAFTAQY